MSWPWKRNAPSGVEESPIDQAILEGYPMFLRKDDGTLKFEIPRTVIVQSSAGKNPGVGCVECSASSIRSAVVSTDIPPGFTVHQGAKELPVIGHPLVEDQIDRPIFPESALHIH